jgi:hypothetical protein
MHPNNLKLITVVLVLAGSRTVIAQRATKTATAPGKTAPAQSKTAKSPAKSTKAAVKRAPKLELPVELEGGCGIECCKYGPWHSTAPVMAFAAARPNARVAFRIDSGETIRGLRGLIYTTKPGIVIMRRPDTIFVSRGTRRIELALGDRDTLYSVDVAGEATDAYWWYRGKTYHTTNELNLFAVHEPKDEESYEVISVPKQQWWTRVRNAQGKTGWVLNPVSFDGIDACGSIG